MFDHILFQGAELLKLHVFAYAGTADFMFSEEVYLSKNDGPIKIENVGSREGFFIIFGGENKFQVNPDSGVIPANKSRTVLITGSSSFSIVYGNEMFRSIIYLLSNEYVTPLLLVSKSKEMKIARRFFAEDIRPKSLLRSFRNHTKISKVHLITNSDNPIDVSPPAVKCCSTDPTYAIIIIRSNQTVHLLFHIFHLILLFHLLKYLCLLMVNLNFQFGKFNQQVIRYLLEAENVKLAFQ
jgi:hypothetical protein